MSERTKAINKTATSTSTKQDATTEISRVGIITVAAFGVVVGLWSLACIVGGMVASGGPPGFSSPRKTNDTPTARTAICKTNRTNFAAELNTAIRSTTLVADSIEAVEQSLFHGLFLCTSGGHNTHGVPISMMGDTSRNAATWDTMGIVSPSLQSSESFKLWSISCIS